MKFSAYANEDVVKLICLEMATLQPGARARFAALLDTEMNLNYYDAAIALLSVGAFVVGNRIESPRLLAEAFLQASPEEYIRYVFCSIQFKLHEKRFTSWVAVVDTFFAYWFARICKAYREYDMWCDCNPEPVMDLTARDVHILNSIKDMHCLIGHELPRILDNPMAFLVPSNNEPFKVKKLDKGVIVITDGALCVKLKALSDRRHFALISEYVNGKEANPKQLFLRCGPRLIIPDEDDKNLWSVPEPFGSINPGDTLSFRYNDKRVNFEI